MEQSFYGRINILGGHGTQLRGTGLQEKFYDQPHTNINGGMSRFPEVDCMGTFPRGRANHRVAKDEIYKSRFGDFIDEASGSRKSSDEELTDMYHQNEQGRNWTWRGAVKV